MYDSEEDWDAPQPQIKRTEDFYCSSKNYGDRIGRKDFFERLHIDSDDIGGIIGRGGANIRLMEEQYRVRLNLDKRAKVVEISGCDQQSVKKAISGIKCRIEKNRHNGQRSHRVTVQPSSSRNNIGSYKYRERDYNNRRKEAPSPQSPKELTLIDWDAANLKSEIEQKKRWAKCPKLTKSFYKEHRDVKNLTKDESNRIRARNNNTSIALAFENSTADNSEAYDLPKPVWKFEHCFETYPDLMDEIRKQGFKSPSPIQAQAWPVILSGKDLIGIAQTGTGKTLAFLLPALIHIEYQTIPRSQRGGPNVLIMAPTRELALQIEKEANKYSFRGIRAVCVYGGGNRNDQIKCVEEGVEIIICTPGRLNDLIEAKVIDVNSITYLVLDEADRMLDMGFEPQIRKILLDIRPDRQTILTSATWPPGVRRLAQSYTKNPIQITVGSLDLAATHTVTQIVEIVEDHEKKQRVKDFIRHMQPYDKIIIFCGRKTCAEDLSVELTLDGILCQCLHGARDQSDREQAIADITTGYVKILIATDVASRGLDIADVTHVINLDFPRQIEEYVHRVGRTGRAGRKGVSISYLTRSDWGMAQPLINILTEAQQDIPEELLSMAQRFRIKKDRRFDNSQGRR